MQYMVKESQIAEMMHEGIDKEVEFLTLCMNVASEKAAEAMHE